MLQLEWRAFLEEFSQELLADSAIRATQPPEAIRSGWLGFEAASEAELVNLETLLGVSLPPSYRRFLQTSNGWRCTGYAIYELWPASQVTWFRERNQKWINAYLGPYRGLSSLSDREYLVYGDRQDPARFRVEYLQTALEISNEGDSAIYLLNPQIETSLGEWEAWLFANWLPGAVRYRSFQELMLAERKIFHEG